MNSLKKMHEHHAAVAENAAKAMEERLGGKKNANPKSLIAKNAQSDDDNYDYPDYSFDGVPFIKGIFISCIKNSL